MNQEANSVLATLKDLLLLKEELGLLEGRKVTPEQFKRILPKLAKRTEKLVQMLEQDEPDYTDENNVTEAVEDYYREALEYAREADTLITKLVRGMKR